MSDTTTSGGVITRLANPTVFLNLSAKLLPWLLVLAALCIITGLTMGFRAGEDGLQGIMVYVMYIHVPFAWLSMMVWTIMTISALGTLVWRHPLADVSIKAAAPIGACFTALALITGSIWGKPTWGTWWEWDARMTSVLILFIMYLGVIALTRALDDPARSARAVAILVLVGFINIPIIKFSVDWWNTLHQPASVFRSDGPTVDAVFLWPLLISAIGFSVLFFALHLMSMQNEIWLRRAVAMKRLAARGVQS
ncbi:MAG: heme ABC transporter permease [Rhizobiaceae bacterium]